MGDPRPHHHLLRLERDGLLRTVYSGEECLLEAAQVDRGPEEVAGEGMEEIAA